MRQTMKPRFSAQETKDSKPLAVKPVGIMKAGETPSLTGESIGEAHGVLGYTQTHTLGNQHLKGYSLFVGSREVMESGVRAKQVVLFPF